MQISQFGIYSNIMFILKPNNRVQKSFKKFSLTEYWMANQLKQMKQTLKNQINISFLSIYLEEKQTVPHIFKFLILIHRIVIEQTPYSQSLLSIISKLKWFSNGDFEEAMSDKLIKPFQLFIQKRITFQFYCSTSAESNPEQKEVKTYKLINLLHAGTSFVSMIYILGRYYRKDWTTEFNIGLCMDLRKIYDFLVASIVTPPSKQLLEDIQKLHQKLYQAFYNCYFYKHLKSFVPKWIKTDMGTESQKKINKSDFKQNKSQTCSSKNTSTSSSQKRNCIKSTSINLESSSCFLFNSQIEVSHFNHNKNDEQLFQEDFGENSNSNQQIFDLIKDMEKIVSMINQ